MQKYKSTEKAVHTRTPDITNRIEMSTVGQRETCTQQRVVAFFRSELGYKYLGNWQDHPNNCNIEKALLVDWLSHQDYSNKIINKVFSELERDASLSGSKTLYDVNREVYERLRYGVKVKHDLSEPTKTVWLIDWENPANNHFGIAEEVTVSGENNKRPDIVLYVNGIALGVLELKRSIVSVTEGIRQNLDNQQKRFIRPFFTTVQLLMAGNETEGLRYGVIKTEEKNWLRWKEDDYNSQADNLLLRELSQLCRKERLLEIIHDFIVFDAGTKKTCRHNQYFGVRAAQTRVRQREGGIIWHTQGSGKSLIMVWLAKWIREHVTNSRVLIVTDRTELDEQIEKVFKGVREDIHRTKSGSNLVSVLNVSEEWLICSLIQKFSSSEESNIDAFIKDIRDNLPKNFSVKGELFVFVDECHRTQSGKLHRALKTLLPASMLIGFTGTPLLKSDKPRSIETFGPYIHSYKYDEAVRDGVVLDLHYEARDIDQHITSPEKIDKWFESKTERLTDLAKAQLKNRWATMRSVRSARDRLWQIVADIVMDMEMRDRLKSGYGNALLVADSINSACRYFEMFQQANLVGKCAIITSYRPSPSNVKGEETGEGLTEKLKQYDIYRKMLSEHFNEPEDKAMHKVELFEQEIKKRFIDKPGQMKLLIVVDKLLTGFDAPHATYLYIDKKMRDHGLFQAICRVNRLDGEDKEYGYIIDYKDLFQSLEKSITDYTGEVFDGYDKVDVEGLLKNRLEKGRQRLEETREAIKELCEPVDSQRNTLDYLHYFCATESGNIAQIRNNEPKRVALYKSVSAYLRSYANLANEMLAAGYTEAEAHTIKEEVDHYEKVRKEVKLNSGDYVDMKMYEPAMRHLLDNYIRAEESEKLSDFDDMTLVQLVVEHGDSALNKLPRGLRESPEAVAETIENNVRRLIIDQVAVNPKYFDKMSKRLDALIKQRKKEAIDYQTYLDKIIEFTKKVNKYELMSSYPSSIDSSACRSLYDNLKDVSGLENLLQSAGYELDKCTDVAEFAARSVDDAIRNVKKDNWRDNRIKQLEVRNAIRNVLVDDTLVAHIFEIAKAQHEL